ncbi:hypothetical protein [Pectinatus frisingensis]|uniref:hypothetical protein n=1 Tax=Pectinatus frisingensis TaxID=865 RepID=UPI0018C6F3E1|nr:hypothetical protein [Pectinatus frisingensis]
MEKLRPTHNCKNGQFGIKHGMYGTRLYHIWNGMKGRCLNPHNKDYEDYGGRGIKVCNEWADDSTSFFRWAMHAGYNDNLTIDRINNNYDYCPANCRWISSDAQQRNRRNNKIITFNGESHCLAEWGRVLGISHKTIYSRIRNGWSIYDVLQVIPSHRNQLYRNKNRRADDGKSK